MKQTYRAMQVRSADALEMVERDIPAPGFGEVVLDVEACGVCGADAADIANADPSLPFPRVPGHEVVGRIRALGQGVPPLWKLGQRVGVGRLGGPCHACPECRKGLFQLCLNQPVVGSSCDGGYAEAMVARASGLVSIPAELDAEEAAPILCAGIATFNALKKCGAQAGDLVAIFGIGGLGHMAVQYARKMGFNVAAIGRGADIAGDAAALGAHTYIDTHVADPVDALKAMGGAQAIVSTVADNGATARLVGALAPGGRLTILAPGKDAATLPTGLMVRGERSVAGSITGSPYENERALQFSVLAGIRPSIEIVPLAQANAALQRMKSGKAKFRVVLTMAR
ncbi:alcohol dehydrogenase [Bordetella genomosp. 10]|uniref:Alcohol dehydrogenase n=1 Tax=Bordetella genomosp. 10 TaxID=1416804 RepID=A0A261RYD6_9BORD|nr:alcohol dehydrogenase catalytic domain-containing protein [Bordetella genomosp. 10]OZI30096.1 alcohol dehydrogenase [Bordetella genomosp. 10]